MKPKRRSPMKFFERAELVPPILARMLARHKGGPPLSTMEIASVANMSLTKVETISLSLDWRDIDLPTMRAFLHGCNVDIEDGAEFNRVLAYLNNKHCNWKYLRTSPQWESYYYPLILRYRQAKGRA